MAFQKGGVTKVEFATDGPASPTWTELAVDIATDGLTLPEEETDTTELADGQQANAQKRAAFEFVMRDVDDSEISSVRTEAEANNRIWFRFTDTEGNTVAVPGINSGQRGLIPKVEEMPIAAAGDHAGVRVTGEAVGPTQSDVMTINRA